MTSKKEIVLGVCTCVGLVCVLVYQYNANTIGNPIITGSAYVIAMIAVTIATAMGYKITK